jgi:PPOX class probable F420-dependent enzyme
MPVIESGSAAAERLKTTPLAWLTTVRADGQPQSSYVWFHFDGTDILIASRPGAAKLRNVRANPRVSVHLDGDGKGGGVLSIEGVAEILDREPLPDRLPGYLAKYDQSIRSQLQTTPEELRSDYSATLLIIPSRIRAW